MIKGERKKVERYVERERYIYLEKEKEMREIVRERE